MKKSNKLITNALIKEIKLQIENTRAQVSVSVNQSLTFLYWNISKLIHSYLLKGNRAEYGKEILATVSSELTSVYGEGYTISSLNRMIKFYKAFCTKKIVATVSPQLSWSHFVELITLEDINQREFYLQMSIMEKWSLRQLRQIIGNQNVKSN